MKELTEEQKQIIALKKELALYKAIVEESFEGVLATDLDDRIIVYNKEIAKTEGLDPKDVLGRTEHEVYGYGDYDFPEMLMRHILPEGKALREQRYFYKSPNGKLHHVVYSAFPYYYEGEIQGIFSIGRDVMEINSFINATLAFENQLKKEKTGESNSAHYFLENIVGSSPAMRKCVKTAEKFSQYNIPVMIVGETGTGKELFAQGIHNAGARANAPFISVNCAALPETLLESILFGTSKGSFTGALDMPGLFEQASGGTLFLDEINSMPLLLQSKLLRVLQERRVRRLGSKKEIAIDCRIISATNRDPFDIHAEEAAIIRSDLLFRLSTAVIHIPPLRERKEDIAELCKYFMRKSNQNKSIFLWGVSPDLLDMFYHYDWPGNVRELENVIAASILFVDNQERSLMIEHIPEHIKGNFYRREKDGHKTFEPMLLKDAVEALEKDLLTETILSTRGNISKAAEILGISRQNMYAKANKYHLKGFFKRKM